MKADNLPAFIPFILNISIKSIASIILADRCPLNSLLKINKSPLFGGFTLDYAVEDAPTGLRGNKNGAGHPAPPCVDDPANIYTRTTFYPTSPRAPVPLLTYVKE